MTSDDLIEFGMIPEFIGRLPVLAPLDPLDEEALDPHPHRAEATPWSASTRSCSRWKGPSWSSNTAALQEIARQAKERDTGARGLRSIVEEIMLDIMFELPDIEPKGKYIVTDAVVRGEVPLFEKTPTADKKSA